MIFTGRAWKFGDNVCGDDGIIQFSSIGDLAVYDEPALKAQCFQAIEPSFVGEVRPGDLIVAGENFAHHSHPHVCVALKASGIAAVVVESCDSHFVRKSLNIGLPVVVCPGIAALVAPFQDIELDIAQGSVRELAGGRSLQFRPYAPRMVDIVRAGGLIKLLKAEHAAAA